MLSFFLEKWKQFQNRLSAVFKAIRQSLFPKKVLEKPFYKILCVDDDRSFCVFMQQLAHSLGIQLDAVYSIREAKEAIEKNSQYQAFIIDGHLPDGSGIELIAWIREKKEFILPIGFISRIYQDAASFRILKESFKVDFVLEKPIHPSEVHQLFVQICHLSSQKSAEQEPFPEELLTDLKVSYQRTVSDKVERLEKMILDVQKSPSIENLQILRGEVHKIAGSAGSYGYMAVSDISKNLELDLIKQIDLANRGQLDLQWLASLDDFFTQIKLTFQIKIPELESQGLHKSGFLPSVYIVDENQRFLNNFIQSAKNLSFEFLTESHPDHAIQTLLAADFYPQILLIQAQFQSSSMSSYELIKAFYQKNDELANIIALTTETQALENQIEAFQRGMPIIIAKPFLPSLVLSLLDQIPFYALPLHYKVLIIDDDWDICQYILKTLKFRGLEVTALQNLLDLESKLQSYRPDLILLDVNLTDEAGREILYRLRNEWEYKKLLIGMVALTQQDTYLLQKCYEANVDDILFKPIEGGVLQRKMAYLLKKKTYEILSVKQDIKTGLQSVQTLKHYLKELLNQESSFLHQMLVVFELEDFDSLSSKIKKEAIEYISQAFEDLLKKYEIAVHLGQGRFALVFQGYHPHFVQLFMRHFLLRIHSFLSDILIKKVPFHINETLVLLPVDKHASDVLERSDELLHLARQQSTQSVRLLTDPSFVVPKEVFIFHDGTQSIDFIKTLFEKNAFQVTCSSTLEDVLKSNIYLSLLILTDSFAEAKGLFLLKKLMMQNSVQIPILYLSHMPDAEYLRSFLHQIDYFESPFSLVMIL